MNNNPGHTAASPTDLPPVAPSLPGPFSELFD